MSDGSDSTPTQGYVGYKIPPMQISDDFPYQHKFIDIFGSKMAYIDEGRGDPILFLHGQPTSSYLWRNIMPFMEGKGRIIAPDLIGFGNSDQPDIDYTYVDHLRYFEAFVESLDLRNITIVGHDWGSALGLHFAAQNPSMIKAIVTMEALVAPILPAKSFEAMPTDLRKFFQMVRTPGLGEKVLIEDNGWLADGGLLEGFISRPLSTAALRTYQAPFPTERSRKQVHRWPNELPIAGHPESTATAADGYNRWLEQTDLPWLFFYSTPGVVATPEAADYWAARAKNIETVYIGQGLHYVQEENPYGIGRAMVDWFRRKGLES